MCMHCIALPKAQKDYEEKVCKLLYNIIIILFILFNKMKSRIAMSHKSHFSSLLGRLRSWKL